MSLFNYNFYFQNLFNFLPSSLNISWLKTNEYNKSNSIYETIMNPSEFQSQYKYQNSNFTNIFDLNYNYFQPMQTMNFSYFDSFVPHISSKSNNINDKKDNKSIATQEKGVDLVKNATKYVGKVNSDEEGNKLFSPKGKKHAWCADFVSTVIKDTYGNQLPSSFRHFSSVNELMAWGDNQNDSYLKMPTSNRSQYLATNIRPGDIMIEKGTDKKGIKHSHAGIVVKVHPNGSFETVEGNYGNKVSKVKTHKANDPQLSGFISMNKCLA